MDVANRFRRRPGDLCVCRPASIDLLHIAEPGEQKPCFARGVFQPGQYRDRGNQCAESFCTFAPSRRCGLSEGLRPTSTSSSRVAICKLACVWLWDQPDDLQLRLTSRRVFDFQLGILSEDARRLGGNRCYLLSDRYLCALRCSCFPSENIPSYSRSFFYRGTVTVPVAACDGCECSEVGRESEEPKPLTPFLVKGRGLGG